MTDDELDARLRDIAKARQLEADKLAKMTETERNIYLAVKSKKNMEAIENLGLDTIPPRDKKDSDN